MAAQLPVRYLFADKPLATCPECKHDLTAPNGIILEVNGDDGLCHGRLDSTGTIVYDFKDTKFRRAACGNCIHTLGQMGGVKELIVKPEKPAKVAKERKPRGEKKPKSVYRKTTVTIEQVRAIARSIDNVEDTKTPADEKLVANLVTWMEDVNIRVRREEAA